MDKTLITWINGAKKEKDGVQVPYLDAYSCIEGETSTWPTQEDDLPHPTLLAHIEETFGHELKKGAHPPEMEGSTVPPSKKPPPKLGPNEQLTMSISNLATSMTQQSGGGGGASSAGSAEKRSNDMIPFKIMRASYSFSITAEKAEMSMLELVDKAKEIDIKMLKSGVYTGLTRDFVQSVSSVNGSHRLVYSNPGAGDYTKAQLQELTVQQYADLVGWTQGNHEPILISIGREEIVEVGDDVNLDDL